MSNAGDVVGIKVVPGVVVRVLAIVVMIFICLKAVSSPLVASGPPLTLLTGMLLDNII